MPKQRVSINVDEDVSLSLATALLVIAAMG